MKLKHFTGLFIALLTVLGVSCSSDNNEPSPTPTPPAPSTQAEYLTFRDGICCHDVTLAYDKKTGTSTITTTGTDPYILTSILKKTLPDDSCVLSFKYNAAATSAPAELQIFFAQPTSEDRSVKLSTPFNTDGSGWQSFALNIKKLREKLKWGKKGQYMRFDFGSEAGKVIRIRELCVRKMTDKEKADYEANENFEAYKQNMATHLNAYLNNSYASKVTDVEVSASKVTIKGQCAGSGKFALVDVAPWEEVTETATFPSRIDITNNTFTITADRNVTRDGITYDRAFSKWAIVKVDGGKDVLDSHARYADNIAALRSASKMKLQNKKGLGGPGNFTDLDEMGIKSITYNIPINALLSSNSNGGSAYKFGGKTYYINSAYQATIDKVLTYCYQRGIVVAAIILTPTQSEFKDPECTGGYYSMPNMTTAAAVNLYAAALNYLADRYSQNTHGRINHWIMHNEVDMNTDWTNMGTQPELRYLDRYVKSMRLAYNIVRQYDQNASILGSFTHSWTNDDFLKGYSTKTMIEQIVQYSNAEGDFRWGVAAHPYPQDLSKPEFWKNDTKSTYSRNTDFVTFKNLEVINDWILNKQHYYKGTTKRILFLSENGTNTPGYSPQYLQQQAAGAAWAWKKVNALAGIDAIQWHNYQDNRAEFGLRIGLRKYPDDADDPGGRKLSWFVWQAAGTANEDEVFKPYLSTIGITAWKDIFGSVY